MIEELVKSIKEQFTQDEWNSLSKGQQDQFIQTTFEKSKDKIPGGLADKKKPKQFNQTSLKQGTKVEMEHTSSKTIAKEIAMDHLTEDRDYYKKLKKIEKADQFKAMKIRDNKELQRTENMKKKLKDKDRKEKDLLSKDQLGNMSY